MVSSRVTVSLLIVVVFIAAVTVGFAYWRTINPSINPPPQQLIVSTTTSLYETGLLDALKLQFEAENPSINVSYISQGTGLAIQTAMRGDADMLFVHAPSQELTFLLGGYGVNRKVIAYNFFVIVGPSEDPAGIRGLSPLDALRKINSSARQGGVFWVSRGDISGTRSKEEALWKQAKINLTVIQTKSWYLSRGSGMTDTLKLANEKLAYTLSDMGTYLMNFKNNNTPDLFVLVSAQPNEGKGKELLNVYSVIACNPQKVNLTQVEFNASMKFIKFVVSDEGQNLIARYGNETYGQPLFSSYITLLKQQPNSQIVQWIQSLAYFNGTECPTQFRCQAGDLYPET